MAACYLTTIDNSYDPSVDMEAWEREDDRLGHGTNAYLARIAVDFYGYSDDLPDDLKQQIIEASIDDIIAYDFLNMYRKIKKE